MEINEIVQRYQETNCEDCFTNIYLYIQKSNRSIVRKLSTKYKIDEQEVQEVFDDKVMDICNKFDGTEGKFLNAIYSAVRLGCIDKVRKRNRHDSHRAEVMYVDEEENFIEIYEAVEVAPTTLDTQELAIKKHDQRQLIAELIGNADCKTLTSLSAFIETESYRKTAELIGSTDKTVKSRIRKLANRYDANRHGDYREFFTTATTFVG